MWGKILLMFNSLQIDNLRGIKHAELKDFARINLLFGKNNCGKSTILEALFLVSGQSNPTLPLTINMLRNYNGFSERDLDIEFYNLDPKNKIEISTTGDQNRWVKITQIVSNSNTVTLETLAKGDTAKSGKHYGLRLDFSIGNSDKTYSSQVVIKEGDKENGKVSVDDRYKETVYSQYIPSNWSQSSMYEEFARIVANKKEKGVLDALRKIDDEIKDIQLVSDEILIDIGASQRLPINMVGDGLRKLLMIIVSIYRCRGGVLLIDEIDNGLHFSAMKILWQIILSAAEENDVQLFASTHNIDSLKGLNEVLKEKEYEKYRNEVCAYKLIKLKEGNVASVRYDYPSFQYSIDQELEVR